MDDGFPIDAPDRVIRCRADRLGITLPANPQVDPSQVILRSIQTADGPQLEIRIGHLVCKTKQLTVQRKQGPVFTVQPVGNKVQVKSDRQSISSQHVEYALPWLTGER
ncbi:hypothetical protein [uncultured Gimesia sp.]|uniref:hypothetical protein n=1 Tax=uncultured Gimesia sp. TaxID=1678688 RepID=UPI000ECE9E14|nr:hypothetical protein [Planctomycetaceae bacterium]|tara:strand:- start:73 stop:396 length:324 start_codon:yes stop_codon:yes gene_type:complete